MPRKREPNPFVAGGPVKPDKFFGRERDAHAIMGHLLDNSGSSAIYGEQRIGKTSFLHYLKSDRAKNEWEFSAKDYTFVYFDCAGFDIPYQENFWRIVLKELERETDNRTVRNMVADTVAKSEFTAVALEDLFREVTKLNHRLIILLDEFEKLVQSDVDLLEKLRAFVVERIINLVVCTSEPLHWVIKKLNLQHRTRIASPLRLRQLKLFNKKQTLEFLKGALKDSNIQFAQQDYEFIWHVSQGHPFKIQFAASELFEEYLFSR